MPTTQDSISPSPCTCDYATEPHASLNVNGYACIKSVCLPADVAKIRIALWIILKQNKGLREGALFDTFSVSSDGQGRSSIQMSSPSNYAPELLKTSYVINATRLAKVLLAPDCILIADYALLKPALTGRGTPWHQDEAYRDANFTYSELTFWMPLQDVGLNDGCMSFVPNSHHLDVLEHRSPADDPRIHAIECVLDLSTATSIQCPLLAGDCTIHTSRVLHRTSDNTSNTDRLVYILVFGRPPIFRKDRNAFPWLAAKITARDRLRRTWIVRGGLFLLILRKIKSKDYLSSRMLIFTLMRKLIGVRSLFK